MWIVVKEEDECSDRGDIYVVSIDSIFDNQDEAISYIKELSEPWKGANYGVHYEYDSTKNFLYSVVKYQNKTTKFVLISEEDVFIGRLHTHFVHYNSPSTYKTVKSWFNDNKDNVLKGGFLILAIVFAVFVQLKHPDVLILRWVSLGMSIAAGYMVGSKL